MDRLTDSMDLEKQFTNIEVDIKNVEILVANLVDKNARTQMDQSEYKERYDACWNEYQDLQAQRTEPNTQIDTLKIKRSRI